MALQMVTSERVFSLYTVQEALAKHCNYSELERLLNSFGETMDPTVRRKCLRDEVDDFFDALTAYVKKRFGKSALYAYVEVFANDEKLKTLYDLDDDRAKRNRRNARRTNRITIHALMTGIERPRNPKEKELKRLRRRMGNPSIQTKFTHTSHLRPLESDNPYAWPPPETTMHTYDSDVMACKMFELNDEIEHWGDGIMNPCDQTNHDWMLLFFVESKIGEKAHVDLMNASFVPKRIGKRRHATDEIEESGRDGGTGTTATKTEWRTARNNETTKDVCSVLSLRYANVLSYDCDLMEEKQGTASEFLDQHRAVEKKMNTHPGLKTRIAEAIHFFYDRTCDHDFCYGHFFDSECRRVFRTTEQDGILTTFENLRNDKASLNYYAYGEFREFFYVSLYCRKHNLLRVRGTNGETTSDDEEEYSHPIDDNRANEEMRSAAARIEGSKRLRVD